MNTPFSQLSQFARHIVQAIPYVGSFGTSNQQLVDELLRSGWVELRNNRLILSSEGARALANAECDPPMTRGRSGSSDRSQQSASPTA